MPARAPRDTISRVEPMQESAQVPPDAPAAAPPTRRAAMPPELVAALDALRGNHGNERDASALEAWLRPRLVAYFAACGAPASERADLVQIVLRRVFAGVSGLRELARFEPWLFTIARNVARTQGERRARDPLGRAAEVTAVEAGGRLAVTEPDPESRLLAVERVELLERGIRELPARQRQCLLLRVRQELSYEEIGALLELSAHTVRNHLAEARARLRRLLGDEEAEG
jgi:RNA polymerase sigma-70 factor (ECF subfamily)